MSQSAGFLVSVALAGIVAVTAVPEGHAQGPALGDRRMTQAGAAPPPRVYDLKVAIETALRNQPALATAEARSRAARTGIAVEGAQYRPYFEAHASAGKTLAGDRDVAFRDDVGVIALSSDPFYTAALSVVVPLIREGRLPFMTLPSEEIAKARHESVKFVEQLTRSEVVRNAAVAFFTVLSAKEDVGVNERVVDLNRLLLDESRLKFQQQIVAQVDVLAAESALVSAQAELSAARTNLARNLESFLAALGLDPSSGDLQGVEVVDGGDGPPPVRALDDLLREVTSRHPSVLAQAATVRQAMATLEQQKTERYPTLDARATIGTVDDYSLPLDFWSFRSSLRLNWRIFDFGGLNLRIKQQAEIVEAEKRALEQARNQAAQPVITAYGKLRSGESGLSAAQKAVDLAEEQVRVARQRFGQNLIPRSDLLRSEVNLAGARKSLVQGQYALRIDHAILQEAIGAD